MEGEECTGFSEKLHLVGAEARTDLEENAAHIWTSVSNLKWLHCCSALVLAMHSALVLQWCYTVCTCTHDWMVLVQALNSPLKRQLPPSKTSPLPNISTDFFLQREMPCSTELHCSRRRWAFFFVHICSFSLRRQSTRPSLPSEWKMLSLLQACVPMSILSCPAPASQTPSLAQIIRTLTVGNCCARGWGYFLPFSISPRAWFPPPIKGAYSLSPCHS